MLLTIRASIHLSIYTNSPLPTMLVGDYGTTNIIAYCVQ